MRNQCRGPSGAWWSGLTGRGGLTDYVNAKVSWASRPAVFAGTTLAVDAEGTAGAVVSRSSGGAGVLGGAEPTDDSGGGAGR
eukprot:6211807-Pleurochrysis_carterae.AAC.2